MATTKPKSFLAFVLLGVATMLAKPTWGLQFEFTGQEEDLGFTLEGLEDDENNAFSARGGSDTRKCRTIAELICSNDDFSILCEGLMATGLDEGLDNRNSLWTLFAPTDEAFGSLDNHVTEGELVWNFENLEFLLLLHAVKNDGLFSSDLECSERIEMANRKDTRTFCSGDMVFQKGGGNSDNNLPKIVEADNKACNGVMHVINNVILPPKFPGSGNHKQPSGSPYGGHKPTNPYDNKKPTNPYNPYKNPNTPYPTPRPTPKPTRKVTRKPTPYPTHKQTRKPTPYPTHKQTRKPTPYPTPKPSKKAEPYYPPEPYHPPVPEPYYPNDDGYGHADDVHDMQKDGRIDVCPSIAEVICTTPGFDLLCEAFTITNLLEFLEFGSDWTLFAPTNEAIEKLIATVPKGTLGPEGMANLLLFQLIENRVLSFDDLRCEEWNQMSDGGFSYTHCRGFDKYQVGRGNGFQDSVILLKDSPIILREDIFACNGIIHSVDTMMLPEWWGE